MAFIYLSIFVISSMRNTIFEIKEALKLLNSRLEIIGNLVHDSVPISNDEVKY